MRDLRLWLAEQARIKRTVEEGAPVNRLACALKAAGEVRGGTGREGVLNLSQPAHVREPWSKWFHPGIDNSWVTVRFPPGGALVSGYGMMSANDCPGRDPSSWCLLGRFGDEWKLLHAHCAGDEPSFPGERFRWLFFALDCDNPLSGVKLEIHSTREPGAGVQLAKLHVFGVQLTEEPAVPPELTCALTSQLFRDPVFTAGGCTYERAALEASWGGRPPTDPVSGTLLASRLLTPNLDVRRRVATFLEAHPYDIPAGWPDREQPPVVMPEAEAPADEAVATRVAAVTAKLSALASQEAAAPALVPAAADPPAAAAPAELDASSQPGVSAAALSVHGAGPGQWVQLTSHRDIDAVRRCNVSLEQVFAGGSLTLDHESAAEPCTSCLVTCNDCGGTGLLHITYTTAVRAPCRSCGGKGMRRCGCSRCDGSGWIVRNECIAFDFGPGVLATGLAYEVLDRGAQRGGNLYIVFDVQPHPLFERSGTHDLVFRPMVNAPPGFDCARPAGDTFFTLSVPHFGGAFTLDTRTYGRDALACEPFRVTGKGLTAAGDLLVCLSFIHQPGQA